MDKVKPYYEAIEDFMAACEPLNVQCMVMVAITDGADKDETADVIAGYQAGAFELANIAGRLQLHANYEFMKAQEGDRDDETA